MPENTAVAAIYNKHTEAESVIKGPQRSGFDIKKPSIDEGTQAKGILQTAHPAEPGLHDLKAENASVTKP